MTGRYIGSRLFLSCDLVGSTRRKQNGAGDPSWITAFLLFYQLFPALFREELAKQEAGVALQPSLWKAVGDELLFVCDVTHEDHVYALVTAWLSAMTKYEAELQREGLSTKGSAFIATFPEPDREVRIARELSQSESTLTDAEADNERAVLQGAPNHLEDFLGPSVDTGFRVMARASHRFFTMSVEVTWGYAAHCLNNSTGSDALVLLEETQLKGVWSDRAYPVFALDRQYELPVNKTLAKVRGDAPLNAADVCALCEACGATDDWPSSLHLPDSARPEFVRRQEQLNRRGAELDSLQDSLQSWPDNYNDGDAGEPHDVEGADDLPADLPVD